MTQEERRAHWRNIVEAQTTSGLNIAEWCRKNRMDKSYFYQCRRRVRQICLHSGFIELPPDKPVDLASGVCIRLGELSIDVQRGFDPGTLRAVIELLGELSRCSA